MTLSILDRVIILGQISNVDSFRFGDRTGSQHSCSTIVDGKMTIFGGESDHSNQISLVENCGLTRVGTLPMGFWCGSCNSFQKSNGESHTLLCFGSPGKSDCHRYFKFHNIIILTINFSFDGSNIVSTVRSNYAHSRTSLGSINNVPIAVGGLDPKNKNVESLQDGRWTNMGDFPFVDTYIACYSLVTFQHAIYLFGKILNFYRFFKIKFNLGGSADEGYSESWSHYMVAKMDEKGFDRNIWSKMGTFSGRYGHRSIVLHNKIVHVGGAGT